MKIGYARVSTITQKLDSQTTQLVDAGCERIFSDKLSAVADRPGLTELIDFARPGDALVVTKFDRLARSVIHMLKIAADLQEKEIELISIGDNIDTTTPHGKFFFTMIAAVAELERSSIRDRTQRGLDAARAKGRIGGRPRSLTDDQIERAITLQSMNWTITAIAQDYKVAVSTLSRAIKKYQSMK